MKQIIEYIQQNAYPLFLTTDGTLNAEFDNHGFFLSETVQPVYNLIRHQPHIYVAFKADFVSSYVGRSFQHYGRWKRSHAYHLGTLAYCLLDTLRYDDQNHQHWIDAWFFSHTAIIGENAHSIDLQNEVFISFIPFELYSSLQSEIQPQDRSFTNEEKKMINKIVEKKLRKWFRDHYCNSLNKV